MTQNNTFFKTQKFATSTTFVKHQLECWTHASFVGNHGRYTRCQFQHDQRMAWWLIPGVFFPAFRCTTCLCTWTLFGRHQALPGLEGSKGWFWGFSSALAPIGWGVIRGEVICCAHWPCTSTATAPWILKLQESRVRGNQGLFSRWFAVSHLWDQKFFFSFHDESNTYGRVGCWIFIIHPPPSYTGSTDQHGCWCAASLLFGWHRLGGCWGRPCKLPSAPYSCDFKICTPSSHVLYERTLHRLRVCRSNALLTAFVAEPVCTICIPSAYIFISKNSSAYIFIISFPSL